MFFADAEVGGSVRGMAKPKITPKTDIPEWTFGLMRSLLQAIQQKDPYTYGHCHRVARLAGQLAAAAGLNEYEQHVVEAASLFHDLGKMAIPDKILLKPGRLTLEEAELMRTHPAKSVEIIKPLAGIDFFKATLPGIENHHERIDGLGYPHRIKGSQIPLHARLIIIVDTFDAMTSSRPYRKALTQETAFKELKTFAGRQFDAQLVKIFLEAYPKWAPYEAEITDQFLLPSYRKAA